jgi:serine/threonine protein kinase
MALPHPEATWLADRFEVEARLGAGTFAEVYRARDHALAGAAVCAVKVLRPDFVSDSETLDRFVAEARALMAISSPNVVRAYDLVYDGDVALFAMEYVPGESLRERLVADTLAGQLMPLAVVGSILDGLAAGLSAVHGAGLVHRDIKPANILVTDRGGSPTAKLVDLGVARRVDVTQAGATTAGRFLGTLAYATPEQLGTIGARTTAAADVFAWATTAFEALTGRRAWMLDAQGEHVPFGKEPTAASVAGLVDALTRGPRPRASDYRDDLDPAVDALLARCWSVQPEDRPLDWSAVRASLRAALESVGRTQLAPPPTAHRTARTPAARLAPPLSEPIHLQASAPAEPTPPARKGSRLVLASTVLSVATAAALVTWVTLRRSASPEPREPVGAYAVEDVASAAAPTAVQAESPPTHEAGVSSPRTDSSTAARTERTPSPLRVRARQSSATQAVRARAAEPGPAAPSRGDPDAPAERATQKPCDPSQLDAYAREVRARIGQRRSSDATRALALLQQATVFGDCARAEEADRLARAESP